VYSRHEYFIRGFSSLAAVINRAFARGVATRRDRPRSLANPDESHSAAPNIRVYSVNCSDRDRGLEMLELTAKRIARVHQRLIDRLSARDLTNCYARARAVNKTWLVASSRNRVSIRSRNSNRSRSRPPRRIRCSRTRNPAIARRAVAPASRDAGSRSRLGSGLPSEGNYRVLDCVSRALHRAAALRNLPVTRISPLSIHALSIPAINVQPLKKLSEERAHERSEMHRALRKAGIRRP